MTMDRRAVWSGSFLVALGVAAVGCDALINAFSSDEENPACKAAPERCRPGPPVDMGPDLLMQCSPQTVAQDCPLPTLPACNMTTHTCDRCAGDGDCTRFS